MCSDGEFLALSGVQHFAFCRRQWALIHIEQLWSDNGLTAQGNVVHERAHNESLREKRGDVVLVRGLFVRSSALGVAGRCDVVEFTKSASGHPLQGEVGLWRPTPVEYKRGRAKVGDEDRLQLCCQAMCLEEMLSVDIAEGSLYYAATHSRERVEFTESLRLQVKTIAEDMHRLYSRGSVPAPRVKKACRSCSLIDLCLPRGANTSVAGYIDQMLGGKL